MRFRSSYLFRLGRAPGLHLLQVRNVQPHDGTDLLVFQIDRQPVLFRLIGGDVDLDAAVLIQFHTSVVADTVLLAVVGYEETVLDIAFRNAFIYPGVSGR